MPKEIYTARKIFTGQQWLEDHVVVTDKGRVESILPKNDIEISSVEDFEDAMLVPAFVDLQIYGADEKLFAVEPGTRSLEALVQSNLDGGTITCLPTIATNTAETVRDCIEAAKKFISSDQKGIAGIHLEGPWINMVKRGAHVKELIRQPALNEVKELVTSGEGIIKMITLAPEMCAPGIIEYLSSENIVISAGHSNATFKESITSFERGVKAVTHLFNAMSAFHHREPGLAGAAFDHDTVMASIIPDGYHVDFAVIRAAKKILRERLFVITDAVTATDKGYYPHQKAGDKYESSGILSGSALTMAKAMKNIVKECAIETDEAARMCSLYPATLAALPFGTIEVGKPVAMTVLSNNFEVVKMIR